MHALRLKAILCDAALSAPASRPIGARVALPDAGLNCKIARAGLRKWRGGHNEKAGS
jgi:hypothetical protein